MAKIVLYIYYSCNNCFSFYRFVNNFVHRRYANGFLEPMPVFIILDENGAIFQNFIIVS